MVDGGPLGIWVATWYGWEAGTVLFETCNGRAVDRGECFKECSNEGVAGVLTSRTTCEGDVQQWLQVHGTVLGGPAEVGFMGTTCGVACGYVGAVDVVVFGCATAGLLPVEGWPVLP